MSPDHRSFADAYTVSGSSPPRPVQPQTTVVRAGSSADHQHRAVIPPIYLSSTFAFEGFDKKGAYDYTRSRNPTRDELGTALATLEAGAGATATSSGMSAILLLVSLLRPGDLLVAPHDGYGGTYRLFSALAERGSFDVLWVDQTDTDAFARGLKRRPKMVWVETPSNPLLRIVDLAAASRATHEVGALLVADNTFLSPALQQPIRFGADAVVHSTTKYINGHSDVVGGVAVAATAELAGKLSWWANCLGIAGSPFDAYLTLRGLRTLHARLAVHESNAKAVVERLAAHPAVRRVYHPSLPDHPGYEIARVQQSGFGAMVSVELRGGIDNVRAFVEGLSCFSLAESLGGVESLIAHPATMTHASMDEAARHRAGISETLLRISVGIESPDDLLADLSAALNRAQRA
jgi:cystathionine gamma-synthase